MSHAYNYGNNSRPLISLNVHLKVDLRSRNSTRALFTLFENKISFRLKNDDGEFIKYIELQNTDALVMQMIMNLETVLEIACINTTTIKPWILIFESHRARNNCLAAMALLRMNVVDPHGNVLQSQTLRISRSLPSMPSIEE